MENAKTLLKIYRARDDWKHLKLWKWAYDYEKKAEEWNNLFPPVTDDRRIYINTYKQVYDAIDTLPDNPCSWICVAVNLMLDREINMMNNILDTFLKFEEP